MDVRGLKPFTWISIRISVRISMLRLKRRGYSWPETIYMDIHTNIRADIHTDIRADVRIELSVLRTVRLGKDMVYNPPFTLPFYDRHPA